MIGNPANIFVTMRVMKYPTTAGSDSPRISNAAVGREIIFEADIHIEPAVTEI